MTTSKTSEFPAIYKKRHIPRMIFGIIFLLLIISISGVIAWEIQTSRLEAWIFTRIAQKFTYRIWPGESQNIRFPSYGPYDIRMGYDRIPEWERKMKERGFDVTLQARWSSNLLKSTDLGIFTLYPEKNQAGLHILDQNNQDIFHAQYPQRIYPDFESIPPLVAKMLLFIENRKLLDTSSPYRNPAIEWERLAKAVIDSGIHMVDQGKHVPGGSTLATQMEKFRHSPEGITDSPEEKLRQILSASLRTYLHGEKTINTRKQIVVDYINSIPLAASPAFGEVIGLGDGLWVWYDINFQLFNQLLTEAEQKNIPPQELNKIGAAVKSALSLFLAQRRPSEYLVTNRKALMILTDSYLRLMSVENLISKDVLNAAIKSQPDFIQQAASNYSLAPGRRKAANSIRSRLLADLDIGASYNLDRMDLTVETDINLDLQQKITKTLEDLKSPAFIQAAGLKVPYLLESGDPSKVVYSFSLYEHTAGGNALRAQTSNFEGPFNIDEQMKLDLGSSAKLRTLVHYLETIAELHDRYAGLSDSALTELSQKRSDPLSAWAIDYLLNTRERKLSNMLEAAMDRMYSANPAEKFATSGGLLTFENFSKDDNYKIMPVRQAFRYSVNLVFIRLMRDIVYYHIFQRYGITPASILQIDASERNRLLTIFADREGKAFIKRFYSKYHSQTAQAVQELLFMEIHPAPHQLTAVFRFLEPQASLEALSEFLHEHLPGSDLSGSFLDKVYDQYEPGKFSLADIGYIAHVHPLELWVIQYLQQHPCASLSEVIGQSADERQTVYNWLFKTKNPYKQYKRLRTIIELEAFEDILHAWKNLGYPFDYLVPSYATAIGSSGDRPGALAELVGIIQNRGKNFPLTKIESLHFAKNTPYEILLTREPAVGKQVLKPEIAQIVKQAMTDVVEEGTARRLNDSLRSPDGTYIPIGGKTGTGDHRYKTFGRGGLLIGSVVMNRAAIFVFFIGDRYFGAVTAYVPGKQAEDYSFSSALPAQILKMMIPDIAPFINNPKGISHPGG